MKVRKFSYQLLVFLLLFFSFLNFKTSTVLAQDCDQEFNCDALKEIDTNQYSTCLNDQRKCWESRISQAKTETNTLQSAINILNGQIQLQSVKIQQTVNEIYQLEKEIDELTQRIEGLSISLDKLSGILIERIRASYKQSRKQYKANFFASDSFNDFITQYRYLNQAQEQTLEVMRRTELQRASYDQQKQLKEEKQAEVSLKKSELEGQKAELDAQKSVKNSLLAETKSNEAIYQQKLSMIRAELEAINAIIAGKGKETLVRDVKTGEIIASIIQGASCNSSGTHLHFSIIKNDIFQNPFNYLQNIDHQNCSTRVCESADSDPFNTTGSWPWPINGPVILTQGYGITWAVSNTWVGSIYSFHDGIDIKPSSNSYLVKSIQDGKLYHGSYTSQTGCYLPYVKVEHQDNTTSLYLHVNYY